ncbi:o-succinylbenzoate--CoA ligase [Parasphingorhabdus pacifica]
MRVLEPLPVPTGAGALEMLPALERALAGAGPALLPAPPGSDGPAAALGTGEPLEDDEDDPADPTALVIATSGSTGMPKGVLLPASALHASATATHRHLGGAGHWLLAMPAHHIAGIQVLVRSLLAGTEPQAVDLSGGFRPDTFAEAARRTLRTDGPHYTALVPTQLSRLLDEAGEGLAALREFAAVLLGGAATPPETLRRALDAGVRVVTTYGMSETSGGCVYDGTPLDGVRVHLDDPSGRIRLAGPMVARGYRRTHAASSGSSASFAGGWFHTGDLGHWRDGRLVVLGRADDMIITGGVNVAPLPVERALTELVEVREVCVLGIDDREWGQVVAAAVVPAEPGGRPDAEALRAVVRERVGAHAAPKRIAVLDELPLRGPGKPDRQALRALFRGSGGD